MVTPRKQRSSDLIYFFMKHTVCLLPILFAVSCNENSHRIQNAESDLTEVKTRLLDLQSQQQAAIDPLQKCLTDLSTLEDQFKYITQSDAALYRKLSEISASQALLRDELQQVKKELASTQSDSWQKAQDSITQQTAIERRAGPIKEKIAKLVNQRELVMVNLAELAGASLKPRNIEGDDKARPLDKELPYVPPPQTSVSSRYNSFLNEAHMNEALDRQQLTRAQLESAETAKKTAQIDQLKALIVVLDGQIAVEERRLQSLYFEAK